MQTVSHWETSYFSLLRKRNENSRNIERMPAKKDPEYFPLNLNVNLYDFESSFSCHSNYESLETEEDDGMSTDDDIRAVAEVLRSRSGSNTIGRPRRIRNVSLNMTQNSDDEGEEGDSMLSSSDLDFDGTETETEDDDVNVKVDMMDTLVLNIREKLRMDPKFVPSSLWAGPTESKPPSTPYEAQTCIGQTPLSHLRRRRLQQPYPNSKARNPLLSVQKRRDKHHHSYWSGRRSSSVSGKSTSGSESHYELLEHLLQSGSLIKEAVRRLSTNQRRHSPQPSGSNSLTISPPNARFPSLRASVSSVTEEDISSLPLPAN